MPKFNKGDRVVTKSGTHGKVLTILDDGYYAVQFDGREVSKVHESVMKEGGTTANAAPRGLSYMTKLRLKEDFKDDEGSYKKGQVFPMYQEGGVSPKYGTMEVPGRISTLQIPWEKLEVVNNSEYIVRKAFHPGRWFLERKCTSLGDKGDVKAFDSEKAARDYAKVNGLEVVNSCAINYLKKYDGKSNIKGKEVYATDKDGNVISGEVLIDDGRDRVRIRCSGTDYDILRSKVEEVWNSSTLNSTRPIVQRALVCKQTRMNSDPFRDKNFEVGDRVYLYVAPTQKGTIVSRHGKTKISNLMIKWDGGYVQEVSPFEVRLNSMNSKVACNYLQPLGKTPSGKDIFVGQEGSKYIVSCGDGSEFSASSHGDAMKLVESLEKGVYKNAEDVATNAEIMDVSSQISDAIYNAWTAVTACRQTVARLANKITTSDKATVMKDVAVLKKIADDLSKLEDDYTL